MEFLSLLNLLGSLDLLIMMVSYLYEPRNRIYTLLFSITCVGSSAYGFLSGTWPFGLIEIAWAFFGFRKYYLSM